MSLVLDNVSAGYGTHNVLSGIDISMSSGEAVGVLGANGAGKTTLMRVLSGQLRPREGSVLLDGDRITRLSPSRMVRQGVVLVAEGHEVVGTLTVLENLKLGAFRFWPRGSAREVSQDLERVFEMFPMLAERQGQLASLLSGGQQQMLAIGRALMARPRFILLDEPSLGLAPVVVDQIYERLDLLRRTSEVGMLIVEQNSDRATGFCDRINVMRLGEFVAQSGAEGLSDEQMRSAYFGG
jgi:branched-chain amino acid transport system ATP-binding protein